MVNQIHCHMNEQLLESIIRRFCLNAILIVALVLIAQKSLNIICAMNFKNVF